MSEELILLVGQYYTTYGEILMDVLTIAIPAGVSIMAIKLSITWALRYFGYFGGFDSYDSGSFSASINDELDYYEDQWDSSEEAYLDNLSYRSKKYNPNTGEEI